MLITLILVAIAVLIIAYLLGVGHIMHIAASFHLGGMRFLLIVLLILIVFAVMLRR